MSVAVASPGSRYQPVVTAALLGSKPCPTIRPASLIPKAVRRSPPLGSVCGITDEPPTANVAATSRLPPFTEPTASSLRFTPFARPIVWPAGSGNCATLPGLVQMIGSGLDPKNVVAPVPTATPLLLTPVAVMKERPGRFASATVPPTCVQRNPWFAPLTLEKPET